MFTFDRFPSIYERVSEVGKLQKGCERLLLGLAATAATAEVDQLKTFNAVDVSVGICWDPPFGSRKPPRRLGVPIVAFCEPLGCPRNLPFF